MRKKTLNLVLYILFNGQGHQEFKDVLSVWSDVLWKQRWKEVKIQSVNIYRIARKVKELDVTMKLKNSCRLLPLRLYRSQSFCGSLEKLNKIKEEMLLQMNQWRDDKRVKKDWTRVRIGKLRIYSHFLSEGVCWFPRRQLKCWIVEQWF